MTDHELLEFVVGLCEDLNSRESDRPEVSRSELWVETKTMCKHVCQSAQILT